jgi:F-type H+-transporting ATPase subunit b
MDINFVRIGIYIANVIILYFLLRWLLYKPVTKFLKKREDTFANRVKAVEDREKEVAAVKAEYDRLMDEAHDKAAAIINKSNEMAKEHSREVIENAKERARDLLERARREIEQEKRLAKQEMKIEIAEMAVSIAEKVLQREISLEDNQKIIDDFFDKVG